MGKGDQGWHSFGSSGVESPLLGAQFLGKNSCLRQIPSLSASSIFKKSKINRFKTSYHELFFGFVFLDGLGRQPKQWHPRNCVRSVCLQELSTPPVRYTIENQPPVSTLLAIFVIAVCWEGRGLLSAATQLGYSPSFLCPSSPEMFVALLFQETKV